MAHLMIVAFILSFVGSSSIAFALTKAGTPQSFVPMLAGIMTFFVVAICLIIDHEYRVGRWQ